jgi:hypothetical protein
MIMSCATSLRWVSVVAVVFSVSLAGATPKKRVRPDYDGRGAPPTTAADIALWVPRIVLFPIRVAVDYGVRAPIGWMTRSVEHSRTGRRVFRYLFLQPKAPTPAIYPVALYDFGTKPSIGARLYWDDGFLTPGSRLWIKLGTGGLDWWRADTSVRVGVGRAFTTFDIGARRQPDFRYYGIGSRTPESAAARYGARRAWLGVGGGIHLAEGAVSSVFGQLATTSFRSTSYAGDPPIEARVASGQIAEMPTGYPAGYSTLRVGTNLALDTRGGAKRARSGARLDAKLERVVDADATAHAWTRLEARVGGELMLDRVAERQLAIKLELQLVDSDGAVPFLELASVAGSGHLRGFPSGRLYGESALGMIVEYQWPLSPWLDVRAHVGAGNVFGPRLSGVSAGAMRGSFGLSFALAGLSDERQVAVSTAVGTDPFEQGFDVSSYRLVIGFLHDY